MYVDACLGRDREARGHALGAEDPRHLGDVRALAAEQVAHVARALREVIDVLHRDRACSHAAGSYPRKRRSQSNVRVMLERLGDRAVGLAQRERARRRRFGERRAERAGEKAVRLLAEREARRLACAADDAARRAAERREVVGLAARRARGELRREAGGEQQLEPERELVGVRGLLRPRIEQRELVAEEREHAGMRLGRGEQARDGVAHAGRGIERGGVLAQARMAGDRLGARDGHEVALAVVEHHMQAEIRLEPTAEAAARAPHALRDRADASAMRRVEMQDPVGLAVAHRAQDDRLGLDRAGHAGY